MRVTATQVLPLALEILYYKVEYDQESPGQFQLGQVSASSPLTPRSSYFLLYPAVLLVRAEKRFTEALENLDPAAGSRGILAHL